MHQPATVHIANRRSGGLWWRIPAALLLWILLAGPVAATLTTLGVLYAWAHDLPLVPDLDRWEATAPRTSRIVAADGTVVADIPFSVDGVTGHRRYVGYDRLPPVLIDAFTAAEDERFFRHQGVDPRAVVRAALANYRAGRVVEGASTITQQIARNLLPEAIGDERTLKRKVREAILAWRIDREYSKERQFEVYVNYVFLGASAYGVAAAARAYFDIDLAEIRPEQAALIAGLAQAPGRANPYRDLKAARARRDQVLNRMWENGAFDSDTLRELKSTEIQLQRPPRRYGTLAPWHTERVRQAAMRLWPRAYSNGGLLIETTAEPVLSARAEELAFAYTKSLATENSPAPQVAGILWDHRTGYVRATVGARSWQESRFDRSTQGCRQPGSAFKPILYAAALANGTITPGTPLRDAPIAEWDEELNVHWKPANSGRTFRGVALAHDALVSSLNAPAVDIFDRVGSDAVIRMARAMGLTTELVDVRPLALGSSCVLPIELARAFAIIARDGEPANARFAARVTWRGHLLMDESSPYDPGRRAGHRLDRLVAAKTAETEPVLDRRVAYQLKNMMRDVVRRGTASDARDLPWPAAGKTGTTNKNSDAWFAGFTGRSLGVVWLGHDNPARSLGKRRDGAKTALPLWKLLITAADTEREPIELPGPVPKGMVARRIDRETGLLAQPGAGGAIELQFVHGTEPTQTTEQARGVPQDLTRTTREF